VGLLVAEDFEVVSHPELTLDAYAVQEAGKCRQDSRPVDVHDDYRSTDYLVFGLSLLDLLRVFDDHEDNRNGQNVDQRQERVNDGLVVRVTHAGKHIQVLVNALRVDGVGRRLPDRVEHVEQVLNSARPVEVDLRHQRE